MVRRRIATLVAVGAVVLMAANADAATHVFFHIGIGIPIPAPVIVTAPPPPPPVYAPAPPPPPPPDQVYAPAPVYGPAPVYAPPPSYAAYGYVWVPAYSVWTGYAYRTVPGSWVRPPYAHAVWIAPHWEQGHGYARGQVWVNGHWRH